jgi:hypothetical protein
LLTQIADHANRKLSRSNLSHNILTKLLYFCTSLPRP